MSHFPSLSLAGGEKSAMMEEVLVRISEATTTATESGRKVLPSPEEITLAPELMVGKEKERVRGGNYFRN